MKKINFFLSCLLCMSAFGQQLISITPVSSNTILLHFDEGEKDFTNFDEFYFYSAPNATYYGQINEAQALIPANFNITSADDTFYTTAQQATATFFKAKEQVALLEYYVYIRLPNPMEAGKTYTINVANINTQQNAYNLTFDAFTNFSESIHVNQVGMIASATEKFAYVSQWLGKNNLSNSHHEDFSSFIGTTCHIVRVSDNQIIYTGTGTDGLQFRAPNTLADYSEDFATKYWYNSPIWEFDFSEVGNTIPVSDSEEYKIVIEGIGSSFPFKISDKVYDDIYKTISNSLLYQRSGFDRGSEYAPFTKPVDHVPGVDGFEITYSNYRRMDNVNGDEESFVQLPAQATSFINPTNVPVWMTSPDAMPWGSGGHFDAGDFDVYIQHLNLPIYASFLYKLAPNGFKDGDLNIPENNNGVPDILDEVQWTLDFFKRTKGPTGGICGGKETDGYYGPSYNDGSGNSSSEQMWYVYKEDPTASYVYAIAAANFSEALSVVGDPNNQAQLYRDEAIAAYNWANTNETLADLEQLFQGISYAGKVKDLKLTAAAALYSLTGIQEYLDFYKNNTIVTTPTTFLYQFQIHDESLANWIFSVIPQDKWSNFDAAAINLQNIQIQAINYWSDVWGTDDISLKPIRFIKSQYQPPILGTTGSTPQIMPQIMSYYHTQDTDLLNKMLSSNDMMLGGNPENKVYITRADLFGAERYAREVLHDAAFTNAGNAIPGIPLYTHHLDSQENFIMSPPIADWPYMEMNLDARVYFLQSEFTIHQNTIQSMMFYGYLNSLFNPDLILSVPETTLNDSQKITIYPNPNKGIFRINWQSNSTFKGALLYDINGRKIEVKQNTIFGENSIKIETGFLSAGIYILKINLDDDIITREISIQ
ncbi:glycoside hydrolase family 9 protein [uncultured Kordia sp.]|uniref:glycoside hydrolase family 9 protein n=1 Tax=uncultured Kordia sp. TaxID=507699 RepID=UPI0026177C38|nr:glycoside hydrolase family 9 protein [uncultured Kordia sp.]